MAVRTSSGLTRKRAWRKDCPGWRLWLRSGKLLVVVVVALAIDACGDEQRGDSKSGGQVAAEKVNTTRSNKEGKRPRGREVLNDLPNAERRGKGERVSRIVGTEGLAIEDYLRLVIEDAAGFWAAQFATAGYQFDGVEYATVTPATEPWNAGCNVGGFLSNGRNSAGDFFGPFYCR